MSVLNWMMRERVGEKSEANWAWYVNERHKDGRTKARVTWDKIETCVCLLGACFM